MEEEFRDTYWAHYLPYSRIALYSAAALGGAFGILDNLVADYAWGHLFLIRFGLLVPSILFAVFLSYILYFNLKFQVVLMPTIMIVGGSIIAMIATIDPPASDYYYAGLIMVLFFTYTFLQLRFVQATVTAMVLFAAYELIAFSSYGYGDPALISNTFFLIATNYGGMFACYSIEKDRRLKFYQLHVIRSDRRRLTQTKQQLEKTSSEDDLTNLGNRRELQKRVVQCVGQFAALNQPTAVIVIDLDNFKQVNDNYGHVTGDEILKVMAAMILGCVRERDFAFRYGGDEFVILLPGKSALGGIEMAWNIMASFREWSESSSVAQLTHLSLSIGLTELCAMTDTVESIMQGGDEALYKAKRWGKGMIVVIPRHTTTVPTTEPPGDS